MTIPQADRLVLHPGAVPEWRDIATEMRTRRRRGAPVFRTVEEKLEHVAAGHGVVLLRRRAGLRVWPALRQSEDDLVAQVRQMLGAERFDQAFSAGSRLTQQEAVAIVRDQHRTGTQTP